MERTGVEPKLRELWADATEAIVLAIAWIRALAPLSGSNTDQFVRPVA